MLPTKLSLARNYLRSPGRVWSVTSRLGTGNIYNIFLQCSYLYMLLHYLRKKQKSNSIICETLEILTKYFFAVNFNTNKRACLPFLSSLLPMKMNQTLLEQTLLFQHETACSFFQSSVEFAQKYSFCLSGGFSSQNLNEDIGVW
jgi:hypothetical protein